MELSGLFAAVVEASASVAVDTTMVPRRKLPVLFQIGNSDDMNLGPDVGIPMSEFETYLNGNPWFKVVVHSHTSTFACNPAYPLSGDAGTVLMATYGGIPASGGREFRFMFIKDLDQQYPNGSNLWLKGAERHWEWFRQFTLD